MLSKIMIAATLAAGAAGITPAAAAPVHHRADLTAPYWGPQSFGDSQYMDRYGLGYTNTARHDPTDTNG